jgi:hypothetical protein
MQLLPEALDHPVGVGTGNMSEETPVRIVVDSINSGTSNVTFASYQQSKRIPHFTIDPFRQEVWQHLDVDVSAIGVTNPPVEPHRMGRTIWVNVMKMGPLSTEDSFWVGKQIGDIASFVGCVDFWMPFPPESSVEYRRSQLSLGMWRSFEGICGSSHVPHSYSNGPGEMDLEAFGDGLLDSSKPSTTLSVDSVIVETEEIDIPVSVHSPDIKEQLAEALNKPIEQESVLGKFPGRKVKLGSGGKAVQALRNVYGLGEGKFDEALQEHVLDAQDSAGLTPDGVVDSDTWDAIDNLLKEGS